MEGRKTVIAKRVARPAEKQIEGDETLPPKRENGQSGAQTKTESESPPPSASTHFGIMPGSATISFSHADMQWQRDEKIDRRGSERNGNARKQTHKAVGVATDAVNSLSDQRLRTDHETRHLETRGSRATKRSRPHRGENAKCQARVGGQRTARCAVRHANRKNGHCKMARGGRDERRQTGNAAVGFLFSGAASSGETRSVFFTTKVGRVSADGCLSLCRCLRAGGSRLLPWRALGCATPAATALCDAAGRERVGAEITQVCFARRRAGTQLAEGRGCDAGEAKDGSFACLLPTAPDVLACQELVVKVVCGFFGSAASGTRTSSLGLSHVCSREAGSEQHIRARKSARNGGHEAATVRWVWWERQKGRAYRGAR
ncbi:hypothetical protein, conserved in T. vivax [Trypanosoma vivax Y486]|uniref:Uncharacterized protein n=1 Tax=Trypanosoma vivax (strain Y486) TaxID=1055687 RepID=F9WTC7_TRYVY|nr:hypothetical protein, conserved in T. vivax [Trypanosoma vivax Y486]|eukprot:CCD20820.1 hypothetical protein, conserved in T. vivax [Trypanosoma vivax Y486]